MNNKIFKDIFFFDIDDTLFYTTKFHNDIIEFIFLNLVKEENYLDKKKLEENYWKIYNKTGIDTKKQFKILFLKLNLSQDKVLYLENKAIKIQEEFENKYFKKYIDTNILNILNKLKKKYILGIISKGYKEEQIKKLQFLKLEKYFEKKLIFIVEKKNEQVYNRIYNLIKFKFYINNIWMIGDREDNDIFPAKKCGFKTIRVGIGKYNSDFETSIADIKIKSFKELEIYLSNNYF